MPRRGRPGPLGNHAPVEVAYVGRRQLGPRVGRKPERVGAEPPVSPQDVGDAIAVEIRDRRGGPYRRGRGYVHGFGLARGRPVDVRAVRMAPKDVHAAVAVEVADTSRDPARLQVTDVVLVTRTG